MKFDTFLATINDWGRFQQVKYTLICLTYMLPSMMVFTYTFSAGKPDFRCAIPTEIDTDQYSASSNQIFDSMYKPTREQCRLEHKNLELSECQRCYVRSADANQSLEKCHGYVYDRRYYKTTLVEEVGSKARQSFTILLLHRRYF